MPHRGLVQHLSSRDLPEAIRDSAVAQSDREFLNGRSLGLSHLLTVAEA
jgi:hypothetical protein